MLERSIVFFQNKTPELGHHHVEMNDLGEELIDDMEDAIMLSRRVQPGAPLIVNATLAAAFFAEIRETKRTKEKAP